jgi:hypothetical protein
MTVRRVLREHFFAGYLRSEMLSEAGIDSYRTWLISAGAALPAFHAQFARLRARGHGTDADELFVMAASFATMLLVASIEWQSLFPSARDAQILSPLPLRRSEIFGAKLAAMGRFLAMAFAVANLIPVLTYPTAAHLTGAIGAGLQAVLLATAVQGICLLALPPAFGFPAHSALLLVCVASLPLLVHVPGLQALVAARPEWLGWMPPMWWLGVTEQMRGSTDPWHAALAWRGWTALGVTGAVTLASYWWLYRRFGEYASPPQARRRRGSWFGALARLNDGGTLQFLTMTLARSPQHRLLVLAIAGGGLAFAVEGTIAGLLKGRAPEAGAALALPLALGMGMITALTTVFRLPVEWRAHWVFRTTEDPAMRRRQLESAVHAVYLYGAAASVLIATPLLAVTGNLAAAPLAFGMLAWLTEYRMMTWYRIPFTSTYAPSSWPVAITIVIFLAQLIAFLTFGAGILRAATGDPVRWMGMGLALAAGWTLLRRKRHSHWGDEPLLFEDDGDPEVLVTKFAPE